MGMVKEPKALWMRILAFSTITVFLLAMAACGKSPSNSKSNLQMDIQKAQRAVLCPGYGINSDGTVRSLQAETTGEDVISVAEWTDVCSLYTNHNEYVFALRNNGTILGPDKFDYSAWNSIVNVSVSTSHMVGLRSDGTVCATAFLPKYEAACDVGQWEDIVSVCAGVGHTVGLKADGTVVAVGCEDNGACDVSEWKT